MVRILVLKRLCNLPDEQMECQLLDRLSYKRFCGLANATNIPDRNTVCTFDNRTCEGGSKALFDGVLAQLLKKGFIERGEQIIYATLIPVPKQHNSRSKKAPLDQGRCLRTVSGPSGARKISTPPGRRSTEKMLIELQTFDQSG
jgi:transposase, IS5 family